MIPMRKSWSLLVLGLLLGAALPVLARAPDALTIFVNGYPMAGKALWYKDRIYVPLEDVAKSTGGAYQYDATTGTARISVGAPTATAIRREEPDQRPLVRVVWERKYLGGANARVVASLKNVGEAPAVNLEAICIFKDDTLNELSAVSRPVGNLLPGETRTVEFALYDTSVAGGYPSYGYGPGGYYYYPGGSTGSLSRDKILVDGNWTRIYYELKLNYQ